MNTVIMSSSTTSSSATGATAVMLLPLDSEAAALADRLSAAATELAAQVPTDAERVVRRQSEKLARQMVAASRLISRGRGQLDPATYVRAVRLVETSWPLQARSTYLRSVIVALHKWRGHTACLPAG